MAIDKSKLTDEALGQYEDIQENITRLSDIFKDAGQRYDNVKRVYEKTKDSDFLNAISNLEEKYVQTSLALSFAKKDLRKFEKQDDIYKVTGSPPTPPSVRWINEGKDPPKPESYKK